MCDKEAAAASGKQEFGIEESKNAAAIALLQHPPGSPLRHGWSYITVAEAEAEFMKVQAKRAVKYMEAYAEHMHLSLSAHLPKEVIEEMREFVPSFLKDK
jgi:hypothetical protein